MPQGLQVFNAAGQLILDVGSRPIRLLTVASIPDNTTTAIPITKSANTTLFVEPVLASFENTPEIVTQTGSSISVNFSGITSGATRSILIMEF
jgi:hypothetical protein